MCVCICVYVIQSRICMSRVKAPQSLLLAGWCCVESFRLHISIVKAIQLIGLLLLYYHLVIFFFFKKEKQTLLCEFIELHPPEGNELKFLREFIYFFFFLNSFFIFFFSFPFFRVHLIVGAKVTSHLSRWQRISRHLSTAMGLLPPQLPLLTHL